MVDGAELAAFAKSEARGIRSGRGEGKTAYLRIQAACWSNWGRTLFSMLDWIDTLIPSRC